MKRVKANSETIKLAIEAAALHFSEKNFKFFWDDNDLCFYFKEGIPILAANVFVSTFKFCTPGLSTKIRIVDADSDFWK